jgi:hypothetical protein
MRASLPALLNDCKRPRPKDKNKRNLSGENVVCIGNHSTPVKNTSFEGGGNGIGLSHSHRLRWNRQKKSGFLSRSRKIDDQHWLNMAIEGNLELTPPSAFGSLQSQFLSLGAIMPSAQDCAERLREQAYRTLLPQIRDLEKELQNVSNSLSTGIHQIGQRLEALSHVELPTTELVLNEILGDVTRETDSKAGALVLFAHSLHQKDTQEEILTLLLDAAHRHFPRTALYAVRGNRFVGWSSRGFSEAAARDISSGSFLRSDCPKFDEILAGGSPVTAPDFAEDEPLQFLKEEMRGACRLVPLTVLDRPVALLVAGGLDSPQVGIDALSLLAEFTVLRLENIALKILYELTAARREAGFPQEEPAAMPAITPAFSPAAAPETASSFDLDSYAKPVRSAETAAFQEESSSSQSFEQAGTEALLPEPEPPKIRETRPLPEEEKLHSDARRFARLLVSEIKLYNDHHVVEGRENQDLYLRLKRDIDRSREMYEKRVSTNVSRKIDYFHDEIIRILGDNDPSTLGSDYPGPRVES